MVIKYNVKYVKNSEISQVKYCKSEDGSQYVKTKVQLQKAFHQWQKKYINILKYIKWY